MTPTQNRTFGISTLLIVVTWIATTLTSYQVGISRGKQIAAEHRRQQEITDVLYNVGQLVNWFEPSGQNNIDAYNPLIELIQNTSIPAPLMTMAQLLSMCISRSKNCS